MPKAGNSWVLLVSGFAVCVFCFLSAHFLLQLQHVKKCPGQESVAPTGTGCLTLLRITPSSSDQVWPPERALK